MKNIFEGFNRLTMKTVRKRWKIKKKLKIIFSNKKIVENTQNYEIFYVEITNFNIHN